MLGFGGPATIINSDMIPFHRRGMYQAMQNGVFGFGAICGASFGGTIADSLGWRWCFLLQVPLSMFALVAGHVVLKNEHLGATTTPSAATTADDSSSSRSLSAMWKRVDFSGALLLVLAVSTQLLGLSLGGNELPWGSPWVLGALATSVALFALFVRVEERTAAMPIIPLRMLRGRMPVATQIANICAGMSSYGVSFPFPQLIHGGSD